jgi:O-succinylbenzoic acid--CoA ligase
MSKHFATVQIEPGLTGVTQAMTAIHELFEDEKSVALVAAENIAALEAIETSRPLIDEEPCLILATSGSTGTSRGVEISVSALAESAAASAQYFGSQAVWLTALPVTSMGGLNTVIRSALAGTEPVIWDGVAGASRFEPIEFLPYLQATVVGAAKQNLSSAISLVPTQLYRLAQHDECLVALSRIDQVLVGGGATSKELIEVCNKAGINLIRTYGATETSGGCVYNGEALDGVELDFDADHRMTVRGPMVARGYRDGEIIGESGWLSSDRGEIANGRLHILGRVDDVIKTAGRSIDLQVIQNLALTIRGVHEVVVVGKPHQEYGAIVSLVFVGEISPADLKSELRDNPATEGSHLEITRVTAIPLLPNGKADRMSIAQL